MGRGDSGSRAYQGQIVLHASPILLYSFHFSFVFLLIFLTYFFNICSFRFLALSFLSTKYLLSTYYVPGTVLGKDPCPQADTVHGKYYLL